MGADGARFGKARGIVDGRAEGDRLGAEAFSMLAIALLAVAGAYTLGAAAAALATS
jgi:hypothetical protein